MGVVISYVVALIMHAMGITNPGRLCHPELFFCKYCKLDRSSADAVRKI